MAGIIPRHESSRKGRHTWPIRNPFCNRSRTNGRHWLAYEAIESGKSQIYVLSFPQADQKRQVSTTGGVQPQWRPDGKGLYFLGPDGKLMSVDITAEPVLSSGMPRPLFDTGITAPSFDSEEYATSDGKRFLMLKLIPMDNQKATPPPPPTVIVNWKAGLKSRTP